MHDPLCSLRVGKENPQLHRGVNNTILDLVSDSSHKEEKGGKNPVLPTSF